MSRHPITEQPVALSLPGMDRIDVERGIRYTPPMALSADLYRPVQGSEAPAPAVVLVTGYSDLGAIEILGCKLKDMAAYDGWARLLACSGLAAVTYDNEAPWRDAQALIDHLQSHADELGIDAARIGIWSCSGNVPTALALLAARPELACAALCYGYMLDAHGHTETADAAAQIGFAVPEHDIPPASLAHAPMLVVRAGRDETPGLNASLDRFVGRALGANLPLAMINHPEGPHAFDIAEPSAAARAVIRQVLAYLQTRLIDGAATEQ